MMKIFGIGLSRTGTTTLTRALELLGYTAVHYPQSIEAISRFDAATDTPVALWYKTLDRIYPGARFVHTVRSMDSWLASCERHWAKAPVATGFVAEIRQGLYGRLDFDQEAFEQAYERHQAEIHGHFRGREEDLLDLDICGGEGWERLCPFLGAPIPSVPFPKLNAGNPGRGNGR